MATGSVRYIHQKSHGALPQKEVISLLDTLIAELEAADVSMKRSPEFAWSTSIKMARSIIASRLKLGPNLSRDHAATRYRADNARSKEADKVSP
jgi:flagellin-specific chaperone FliS